MSGRGHLFFTCKSAKRIYRIIIHPVSFRGKKIIKKSESSPLPFFVPAVCIDIGELSDNTLYKQGHNFD